MRLIDADNLLKMRFSEGFIDGGELLVSFTDVVNAIRQAPTVDAVEVVRCKDCVCSRYIEALDIYKCDRRGYFTEEVKPDDYCSRGAKQ